MKKLTIILVCLTFQFSAQAQCAMCRATLENNVSQGNIGIAAGINFGILYLLVIPYLAIGALALFWYRSSRKNAIAQSGQGVD
ncbi:MAG: hypothetical protein ACKOYP_13000 [Bacteroidota bacterium]